MNRVGREVQVPAKDENINSEVFYFLYSLPTVLISWNFHSCSTVSHWAMDNRMRAESTCKSLLIYSLLFHRIRQLCLPKNSNLK